MLRVVQRLTQGFMAMESERQCVEPGWLRWRDYSASLLPRITVPTLNKSPPPSPSGLVV